MTTPRRCVLFSPLGTTDPIRSMYDGPWLHICRKYRPHLTVVYQSHMIAAYDRLGFYDKALAYLNRFMFGEDETQYIRMEKQQDESCVEAHDYNIFMKPFADILRDLHRRFPDDELLVNATSGTPAMQITLMYLHLVGDVPFTLLQVSNPEYTKGNNKRIDHTYDVDDAWDTDLDNESNMPDRCCSLDLKPYVMMQRMDALKDLIRRGAYSVAEAEMATILPFFYPQQDSRKLKVERAIQGAVLRARLETNEAAKKLEFAGYQLNAGQSREHRDAFLCAEYLRVMRNDIAGGQPDLFMLRIPPVLLQLCLLYLETRGIQYHDVGIIRNKNKYFWNVNDMPEDVSKAMSQSRIDLYKLSNVSTYTLLPLLRLRCPEEEVALIQNLRSVEEKRNGIAHDMLTSGQANNEQWVIDNTGFTCDQILDMLWTLLSWSAPDIAQSPRDYNDMNQFILNLLKNT